MAKSNEFRFEVLNVIGEIGEGSKGWKKELTRVSWGGAEPKYDIRNWDANHEKCGKGVTLSEEELRKLKAILDEEIAFLDEEK